MKTAEEVLKEVYEALGPKTVAGGVCRPLPASEFASMTSDQVSASYDFYRADLFHEIAKVLSPENAEV